MIFYSTNFFSQQKPPGIKSNSLSASRHCWGSSAPSSSQTCELKKKQEPGLAGQGSFSQLSMNTPALGFSAHINLSFPGSDGSALGQAGFSLILFIFSTTQPSETFIFQSPLLPALFRTAMNDLGSSSGGLVNPLGCTLAGPANLDVRHFNRGFNCEL